MRHLYNCRVAVDELSGDIVNGTPTLTWAQLGVNLDPYLPGSEGELMCRLDLYLQRPGKDAPMPIVAGRAPDRVGVMFFDATAAAAAVKAGQRVRVLSGPVTGTFEIRATPDPAQDFSPVAHHMEVQVIEVAQAPAGIFPGRGVEED